MTPSLNSLVATGIELNRFYALSNDNVNRPWMARLGFVVNNTHQEALHGSCAS
eukprot:gene12204-12514_t